MSTELTGAAKLTRKRLRECNLDVTIIRETHNSLVLCTIKDNKGEIICSVWAREFNQAVNAAIDIAQGKPKPYAASTVFDGHTCGPWEVLGDQGTCIWAGNEIIAQMTNPRSRHRQARADAVLMASAPTLLEENERLRARVAELEAMIKA